MIKTQLSFLPTISTTSLVSRGILWPKRPRRTIGFEWVDHAGGLPAYIESIAKSIKKTGKTTSQAIAIAVSRCKVWAAGGGNVNADTQAKATKAIAEWERKKKSGKSKKVAKLSNRTGLMESCVRPVEIIALSGPSYNIDNIRSEYDRLTREARKAKRAANPYVDDYLDYVYVKEVWNTHLIVQTDYSHGKLFKVDYTVDGSGNPTFSEPVEVVVEYVEAGKDISDNDLASALS